MHRPTPPLVALFGSLLLAAGCADRGVASGPASTPGPGTWVLVWIAAGLAILVLGALLAGAQHPSRGGAPLAATVLAVHAGAAVVGAAVLAGLAARSWPLADAKAAGTPASGTSLLGVSVVDGDPRFFTLMLVTVVLLGSALALLLTVAARFARGDDPLERLAACAVLALELAPSTGALALVFQGEREWPYVLAAAHLPLLAAAITTGWPRPGSSDPETRYNGPHG